MPRTLTPLELIERSLQKKYRKALWTPFILAVKRYALIRAGDRVAVCVSGGKDSMLLAMLMRQLERYGDVPFQAVYLAMDPGFNPPDRRQLEENGARLGIPLEIFETDVFRSAGVAAGENPCYLCARMRRGHLYSRARELGCGKIALGHHFNDVIETTVMGMLYGAQLQGMMPKLRSAHFPGMELIRPLYCVREADIAAWRDYHGLHFSDCACRFAAKGEAASARRAVKALIEGLRRDNPDVEKSLFSAIHSVCPETFPGWKQLGERHSFLERYGDPDPAP
ncbi:MAG: tRNA 2-thiocytidine biosynthesis protein TtcA [Clostridia bacterium]|nr:tRNA 2-thiocytidine biosynthesis protein TtcA [Clostridia bacterium]